MNIAINLNIAINYLISLHELISNYFNKIELYIILIIVFIRLFQLVLHQIVVKIYFDKHNFEVHHIAYKQIRYYSLKFITLTILLLALTLATYELFKHGENILKYSPFLGLIGAAITFALQEVVLSFAGWLRILFGRFYFFGDRIKLGNIVGDIIDIGFFRTTLLECGDWVNGDLYNGRIVRIANSFVFKEPVYNYNSKFKFLWDEIKLSLTHESDYEKVKTIIEDTIKEIPIIEQSYKSAIKEWNKITNKYFVESAETSPLVSFSLDRNAIVFTVRYVVQGKLI